MFNDKASTQKHIECLVEKYKYRKLPVKLSESSHMMYLETIPDWVRLEGDPAIHLFSSEGTLLSVGYKRVVVGDYGAYIEIEKSSMNRPKVCVAKGQEYRYRDPNYSSSVKYYHYTLKDSSNIKIYFQQKTVSYADYKPDHFYVSVFDVLRSGVAE